MPWSILRSPPRIGTNNIFVIDHSLAASERLRPTGTLVFELTGQNRNPGGFFYAEELAVDASGYLYVLNQVMQPNGFFTEKEEVLRFDTRGNFDRVVESRTYAPEEIGNTNATRGRMVKLTVSGRHVSWFELSPSGVIENSVDTMTWNFEQHVAVPVADAAVYVASVVRIDPHTMVYTTKQGFLLKQIDNGTAETLYSGDQASAAGSPVGSLVDRRRRPRRLDLQRPHPQPNRRPSPRRDFGDSA